MIPIPRGTPIPTPIAMGRALDGGWPWVDVDVFVVKGPDEATPVALDRLINTSWVCVGAVAMVDVLNKDDNERKVAVVETDHKTEPPV